MNKPARSIILLMAICLWPAGGFQSLRAQNRPPDAEKLAALLQANSFREADRLASTILSGKEIDSQTLAVCGLAVLKAGRIDESEAIFRKVISSSPDNPEAHLGLGRIARLRNNNDPAIVHFRRALPSVIFYDEALRQLWKTVWDRGLASELLQVRNLAEVRLNRESRPLPSYIANGLRQLQGREEKRLFRMEGRFERLSVPFTVRDANIDFGLRMISLKLNGKGEYPFDIDSASADFLTISPLLAEALGLVQTGSALASGVGTREAQVRFALLDKVEVGPVAFFDVPVMVSDIQSFRGQRKGLLGTALLKRFNVMIDAEKNVMNLYPLDRPDLLAADIDPKAIAADVPLYIFDQTVVAASPGGAPEALYILDSAAATNLSDGPFFAEHIRPKLDPSRLIRGGIQGAGGAQETVHEFSMEILNMIAGRLILEKRDRRAPL